MFAVTVVSGYGPPAAVIERRVRVDEQA